MVVVFLGLLYHPLICWGWNCWLVLGGKWEFECVHELMLDFESNPEIPMIRSFKNMNPVAQTRFPNKNIHA